MRDRKAKILATVAGVTLFLGLSRGIFAITHTEVEMACPICGTKNGVVGIMSWGSYIYQFPSRFQLVFFPSTDSTQLYHCKRCHFTAWPQEFEKFPADKRPEVEKLMGKVWHANHDEDYKKIPMSERLEIAQPFYGLMDYGDDFWCHFHRLKGYFLQEEGKAVEAAEARKKALEIALRLAARQDRAGDRKELLTIVAAMHHYLADDNAALQELEKASALVYANPQFQAEQNKNVDGYFSGLIRDYQRAIREGLSTDKPWKTEDAKSQEAADPGD